MTARKPFLLGFSPLLVAALTLLLAAGTAFEASASGSRSEPSVTPGFEEGRELYAAACSTCHGANGKGAPQSHVGFEEELPDFTDCRFAKREPEGDWLGVVHLGGPSRSFSKMMPSFGAALDQDQQLLILGYIRGFCTDHRWPRGELNLPTPLVTAKAYPEDEAVFETAVAAEGRTRVASAITYEKRFGPKNQIEIKVPFGWRGRSAFAGEESVGIEGPSETETEAGLGDITLGWKRVVAHSYEKGRILSLIAEVVLPTGDQDEGLGNGYTLFEPSIAFGKILPKDAFLHLQGGFELPVDESRAEEQAFLRVALGKTFTTRPFGRALSPILEVVGARDLASSADLHWNVVPQIQIALNKRQHVLANIGVLLPMDDSQRPTEILFYVLWDWFDGGLFDGWK